MYKDLSKGMVKDESSNCSFLCIRPMVLHDVNLLKYERQEGIVSTKILSFSSSSYSHQSRMPCSFSETGWI